MIDEDKDPEKQFQDFHDKFVSSQQDLPPEFARILYDNLWDMMQ